MTVILVITLVWALAIVLAVALCVAARMGDSELEADLPPFEVKRTRGARRRFRTPVA